MMAALCRTAQLNLEAKVEGGQLSRCTTLGRAIGLAIKDALEDKRGMRRYGNSAVPMDDALAEVALDFSGRAYLVFRGEFSGPRIGDLETYEVKAVMEALADGARLTLHIRFYGENDHHKAESIFKALGLAMREAMRIEGTEIPSTKGII
jgi:imidazoleglycerol phosphate dehydratase HisB